MQRENPHLVSIHWFIYTFMNITPSKRKKKRRNERHRVSKIVRAIEKDVRVLQEYGINIFAAVGGTLAKRGERSYGEQRSDSKR